MMPPDSRDGGVGGVSCCDTRQGERFEVVPLGVVDAVAVRVVAANVQAAFDVATDVAPSWPDPVGALFPSGRQYNAAELIKLLDRDIALPVRRMGVIAGDISLPFLTYLFGQAQVGGRAAVISLFRLQQRRDGGVAPPLSLVYQRLAAVAVHEAGHLMGLPHCRQPGCIMNFSVGLDRLDRLSTGFCDPCRLALAAGGNHGHRCSGHPASCAMDAEIG